MVALSDAGCIVWRVETAGAWIGKKVYQNRDEVTLRNARMFTTGLCRGGSDIIGIHKATGRFIAIEVKTPTGRASADQIKFIEAVKAAGGIAGIARSPEEALQLLPRAD